MLFFERHKNSLSWLWGLAMSLFAAVLAYALVTQQFRVESDILKLLPKDRSNPLLEQVIQDVGDRSARQWFFMVSHPELDQTVQGAERLQSGLAAIASFARVDSRLDTALNEQLAKEYWRHRRGLLSAADQKHLADGEYDVLYEQALNRLFSPFAAVNGQMLQGDPLQLFSRFVEDMQGQQSWQVVDGWRVIQHQGRFYVLIYAVLNESAFSISQQDKVLPRVDQLMRDIQSTAKDMEILDLSAIRFAAAGVEQARKEINTIGLGSSLGILLLLLIVFRSPIPLLYSVIPVLSGYLAAISVCWMVFGSIYLMVLVMGTSLLGLCNDYAMHFFVDREAHWRDWKAEQTLGRIFSALSLGMITSVVAFVGMLVAPFPGMQQLALFSAVGLLGTYLTVMCLFARVIPAPHRQRDNLFIVWAANTLAFLRKPIVQSCFLWGLAATLLGSLWAMGSLNSNDDVRFLQSRPDELLQAQQRWIEIILSYIAQQFLLVTGDQVEEVLLKEEQLLPEVRQRQQAGDLLGFLALSPYLPSQASQAHNRDGLLNLLQDDMALGEYLEHSGLDQQVVNDYRKNLQQDEWLTLESAPAFKDQEVVRQLWLGQLPDGTYGSLVLLDGLKNHGAIEALANRHVGVFFVDKTAMVSELFGQYRYHALLLLLLAYLLIAVGLGIYYGPRRCFWVMLPPLSAAWLTIALISASGHDIHLFHFLGLILVLGAGIDYTLFLEESTEHSAATWLTIMLSATATVLSFGLLALSQTEAVRALGMTVWCGITLSLLLAPLSMKKIEYPIRSAVQHDRF